MCVRDGYASCELQAGRSNKIYDLAYTFVRDCPVLFDGHRHSIFSALLSDIFWFLFARQINTMPSIANNER